jgi:hypothetical protein
MHHPNHANIVGVLGMLEVLSYYLPVVEHRIRRVLLLQAIIGQLQVGVEVGHRVWPADWYNHNLL